MESMEKKQQMENETTPPAETVTPVTDTAEQETTAAAQTAQEVEETPAETAEAVVEETAPKAQPKKPDFNDEMKSKKKKMKLLSLTIGITILVLFIFLGVSCNGRQKHVYVYEDTTATYSDLRFEFKEEDNWLAMSDMNIMMQYGMQGPSYYELYGASQNSAQVFTIAKETIKNRTEEEAAQEHREAFAETSESISETQEYTINGASYWGFIAHSKPNDAGVAFTEIFLVHPFDEKNYMYVEYIAPGATDEEMLAFMEQTMFPA